jgi:hypothetical protein
MGSVRSASCEVRCTRFRVALKDNIHVTNMPNTGGALAIEAFNPPYEAALTKNVRDAGAIIMAEDGHDGTGELEEEHP